MKRLSVVGFACLASSLLLLKPGTASAQSDKPELIKFIQDNDAATGAAYDGWLQAAGSLGKDTAGLRRELADVPPPGSDPKVHDQKVADWRKQIAVDQGKVNGAWDKYDGLRIEGRELERRARDLGIDPSLLGRQSTARTGSGNPGADGAASNALGPSRLGPPIGHDLHLGPIFRELLHERAPAIAAGDGNRAYDGEGRPTCELSVQAVQSTLGAAVFVNRQREQEAAERKEREEAAARESAAREQAAARDRAAREQAAERQRAAQEQAQARRDYEARKEALRKEINQHRENGLNGRYRSVNEYNALTEYYYNQWKQLTGEEPGYSFRRP
jgi:hypothetical protein